MAITFDTSNTGSNTDGSAITIALTIGSGANRLLVVSVTSRSISMTVSGITWNGSENLTKACDVDVSFNQAAVWYLVNPTSGTHNVVVSFNTGTAVAFGACAISLLGVDQSTPLEDTDTNSVSATSTSMPALTSSTDGCAMVDAVFVHDGGGGGITMSAETNRVERQNLNNGGQGHGASTIITKSPAGSVSMQWTCSNLEIVQAGAAFKPVSVATKFWIFGPR